jgi:hypothetical protein
MMDSNALMVFRKLSGMLRRVCTGISMSKQHPASISRKRVLLVKRSLWQLLAQMLLTGDQNVYRFCGVWMPALQDAVLQPYAYASNAPQKLAATIIWVRTEFVPSLYHLNDAVVALLRIFLVQDASCWDGANPSG